MSEMIEDEEVSILLELIRNHYHNTITDLEQLSREIIDSIDVKLGTREVETGLAPQIKWDLLGDRKRMSEEQVLVVAKFCKNLGNGKFVIGLKQMAKFVVSCDKKVPQELLQEGIRVGVDRNKYQIKLALPRKIDATITMMQVEEKPDITFNDIGGCKEEIEKIREVVEIPLLDPDRFIRLGIDPPKGVLLYGPPGTGKTLLARAVANKTDACFIRVIGSELVQKYVGEGARMVREIFELARMKKAAIIFFDEVDAFGGTRFESGDDNEVQRTMLELINQLDGFDNRGNVKVLMATNRPDTLDPALLRPGRLDRKVEFGLPDLEGRTKILKIHSRKMSIEKNIRFDLLARLCVNATGAELRSVCTEAGMFAIRERRRVATEKDFLDAVEKVIKGYAKFSATPRYMTYN
ncbi:26S proteasome subunit P45 family protein [Edhazardia aedis USNM 41457]|uniref:26S proteasome regulatory subunit 7 homolog n=1 Tax=Edhazardia aedis (strain USNM 41457) TaxID=1003232 RepID=J9D618_EDHAE|nr:26S proteasome subunit P45 family protein [Edhazardia aedis USNM 41457]|eukprot:EJW02984.1 26S proteasome subunit P45 family protein [Edhazardia aedis USNM 41457]